MDRRPAQWMIPSFMFGEPCEGIKSWFCLNGLQQKLLGALWLIQEKSTDKEGDSFFLLKIVTKKITRNVQNFKQCLISITTPPLYTPRGRDGQKTVFSRRRKNNFFHFKTTNRCVFLKSSTYQSQTMEQPLEQPFTTWSILSCSIVVAQNYVVGIEKLKIWMFLDSKTFYGSNWKKTLIPGNLYPFQKKKSTVCEKIWSEFSVETPTQKNKILLCSKKNLFRKKLFTKKNIE